MPHPAAVLLAAQVLLTQAALLPAAAAAASQGPCDLYAQGGTPCVAAHSVTRALFAAYAGPLYQVRRLSDNATKDVSALEAGGVVDAAAQDAFCGADGGCVIHRLYDQSPHRNHLHVAKAGGAVRLSSAVNSPGVTPTCGAALAKACGGPKLSGNAECVLCLEAANATALAAAGCSRTDATEWCGPDRPVNATRGRVVVGGHAAYAAVFEGSQGYRLDETSGVATGDEPESLYMVVSGTHYNNKCCFDYGNAETNNLDTGKGSMEAIYWGSGCGGGVGKGPWVHADLEDGCWGGNATVNPNPANLPIEAAFVTAMVKGDSGNRFALKGGDAQKADGLKTLYDGPRPQPDYHPMKKQGAIILGVGGDNSNWAVGTFLEGVMTKGFASDATDAAVHANIATVAAYRLP